MTYTDEQIQEIQNRQRDYEKRGYPEKAAALQVQVDNEEPFKDLLGDEEDLQEEIDTLPTPPRNGPGSGVDTWRKFAKQITDMDDDVIDEMSRDEIIVTLEEAELIDTLDPEDNR